MFVLFLLMVPKLSYLIECSVNVSEGICKRPYVPECTTVPKYVFPWQLPDLNHFFFCTPTVACGTIIFVNATLVTFCQSPEWSQPNKYRHGWFCLFCTLFSEHGSESMIQKQCLYTTRLEMKPIQKVAKCPQWNVFISKQSVKEFNFHLQLKDCPSISRKLILYVITCKQIAKFWLFNSVDSNWNRCVPFITLLTLCTTTSWQVLHWINHGYWLADKQKSVSGHCEICFLSTSSFQQGLFHVKILHAPSFQPHSPAQNRKSPSHSSHRNV